jgi:hypothetical protein
MSIMPVIDLIKLVSLDGYRLAFINTDGHQIVSSIESSKLGVRLRFNNGGDYFLPKEVTLKISDNMDEIEGYSNPQRTNPSFYLVLEQIVPANIKNILATI